MQNHYNLWIAKRYQQEKNCKIRGDFSHAEVNEKVTVCANNEPLIANDTDLDVYTINMIKAVYAFAYAIRDYCAGTNPCAKILNRSPDSVKALKEALGAVQIPSSDSSSEVNLKPFDENRDGTGGYEVYQQQYTKDKVQRPTYALVYTFTKNEYNTPDTIKPADSTNQVEFYKTGDDGKENSVNFNGKHCGTNKCDTDCAQPNITVVTTPNSDATIGLIIFAGISSVGIVLLLAYILHERCKRRSKNRSQGKSKRQLFVQAYVHIKVGKYLLMIFQMILNLKSFTNYFRYLCQLILLTTFIKISRIGYLEC